MKIFESWIIQVEKDLSRSPSPSACSKQANSGCSNPRTDGPQPHTPFWCLTTIAVKSSSAWSFSCSADCPWMLQYAPSRKTWLHLLSDPRLKSAERSQPAPQPLVSASVKGNHTQQVTESHGMPGGKGKMPSTSWPAPLPKGQRVPGEHPWSAGPRMTQGLADCLLTHFPGTYGVNHSRVLMDCWKRQVAAFALIYVMIHRILLIAECFDWLLQNWFMPYLMQLSKS